jgi:hypothetical protein
MCLNIVEVSLMSKWHVFDRSIGFPWQEVLPPDRTRTGIVFTARPGTIGGVSFFRAPTVNDNYIQLSNSGTLQTMKSEYYLWTHGTLIQESVLMNWFTTTITTRIYVQTTPIEVIESIRRHGMSLVNS